MDDLVSEFIAETRDTLAALSGEIIAWEGDPSDRARLDSIFRFIHTVKGSCGFLDLPRFERLSHAAEDVLAELRGGTRTADAALVNAVLAIIDRIGELTEALDAGETPAHDDDEVLIAALSHPVQAAPTAAAGHVASAPRAATRSIRIPLERLDRMMSGVSDMVLARNELSRRLREMPIDPAVEAAFERLSGCVADMRDSITQTRMQQIDKLFAALPRTVRDVAAELGKSVDLEIDGSDVELDREMIELIRDPLTHIVRNAIDHGIEAPAERKRAKKPLSGRLAVSARQSGNQIVLEIADDGRGIDEKKLVARAVAAKIVTAQAAEAMSSSARAAMIFEPGLSTAEQVSAISGRGVGMDVVRSNIERIGGAIEIDNKPGQGLRIVIRVPLTLTIIAALTVTAGDHSFAIPRSAIEEIVHDSNQTIRIEALGPSAIATIRGRRLPLVVLERALAMEGETVARGRTLVVVKSGAGCSYALSVAAVHDHEELVIKPGSPAIMATGVYAGMSLPDNGVPMLLLDAAGIAARAGVFAETEAEDAAEAVDEAPADTVSTLLFRDLDGAERGIRLAIVERVEEVDAADVRRSAGAFRVALDGRLFPLAGTDAPPETGFVKILRLSDGGAEIAYAIGEVLDIVALPREFHRAGSDGPIAGVALVGGAQVELVDPFWLFAQHGSENPEPAHAPLCLLTDGDDRWTREILRPLVEAAGYRVALPGDESAPTADVVIASTGTTPEVAAKDAPVVRLRPDRALAAPGDDSVYRYDRAGLLAALKTTLVAGRG